jgi:uncharacterized membrane protein
MAKRKSFSIKQLIQAGWNTTTKNFWFLIGVTLILGLSQFLPNLLSGYTHEESILVGLLNIITYIIFLGLTLGSLKIYLSFVDGKKPQFSDLLSMFKTRLIIRFFLSQLLYGLIVLFGLILFIFPGIYFGLKYVFVANILVDRNVGVFEAFSKSGEITRGIVGRLFLFQLVLSLVALVGLLVVGVGLLVALPVVSLADMYLYRKLYPSAKS